uniref:RRM domain-containing protein n=1 Tax=Arundo donax TaxID=35708 RepID=A0A0A9CFH4_ARUDO
MMPQPQPGMAPPPQVAPGAPPHWGVIPPPVSQPPQQYAPPLPQQHQAPPPPQMWGQAPLALPPNQAAYGQAPPPQPAYYGAPPAPAPASAAPAGPNEVRTLWIGDLQYWMDENYIYGCFASTGERQTMVPHHSMETTLTQSSFRLACPRLTPVKMDVLLR